MHKEKLETVNFFGLYTWLAVVATSLSLYFFYPELFAPQNIRQFFSDNLAVGHTLGSGHELSLRLLHVSNGAAKKPNPGQNLLQLRYAFSY